MKYAIYQIDPKVMRHTETREADTAQEALLTQAQAFPNWHRSGNVYLVIDESHKPVKLKLQFGAMEAVAA